VPGNLGTAIAAAWICAHDRLAVPVLDPLDQNWLDFVAAIDQLGIGAGELDRRDLVGAQGRGEVALQLAAEAKAPGSLDDVIHTHPLRDPDGDQVARPLQPYPKGDRAEEVLRVVLGLPSR